MSKTDLATFTDPDKTKGTLAGQILVPYVEGSGKFADEGTVTVQGKSYSIIVQAQDEQLITGPDGKSVKYRMVSFTSTEEFDLTPSSTDSTKAAKDQTLVVKIAQGAFSAEYTASYVYSSGAQDITNLYYLPNYKGGAVDSKRPLNGATLQDDKLYILVESGSSLDKLPVPTLKGVYLPSGLKPVELKQYLGATGLKDNEQIYEITSLASGKQQLRFSFSDNPEPDLAKVVEVTYATISSIYVGSIQTGETYTFDSSKGTQYLNVEGELLGFKDLTDLKAEMLVNGQLTATTVTSLVNATDLNNTGSTTAPVIAFPKTQKFKFSLPIKKMVRFITERTPLIFELLLTMRVEDRKR